jgi:hypothetical protein
VKAYCAIAARDPTQGTPTGGEQALIFVHNYNGLASGPNGNRKVVDQRLDIATFVPIVHEYDCVTAACGGAECVYEPSNGYRRANAEIRGWDEEVLDVAYEEELNWWLAREQGSAVILRRI